MNINEVDTGLEEKSNVLHGRISSIIELVLIDDWMNKNFHTILTRE